MAREGRHTTRVEDTLRGSVPRHGQISRNCPASFSILNLRACGRLVSGLPGYKCAAGCPPVPEDEGTRSAKPSHDANNGPMENGESEV